MLGIPRPRRGNYSMLSALMIFVMVGFGAISVDLSLVRLAASQSQDIADAASQAAIVMYRQGRVDGLDDEDARAQGEEAARYIAARNTVAGGHATVTDVSWGTWNPDATPGAEFTSTALDGGTSAAVVSLDRSGSDAIGLSFGRLLGRDSIPVRGAATSATRNIQVVLAMDITGSWDKDEFQYARQAAVAFFDILAANYSPEDRFGVEVWWSNYAYEYVPMMEMSDAVAHPELARDLLTSLNVGNYPGNPVPSWNPPGSTSYHVACRVYGSSGTGTGNSVNGVFADLTGAYFNALKNKWTNATPNPASGNPGQGCHPTMPRYYLSEGGTDHHTGLMMARTMIKDQKIYRPGTGWVTDADPLAYRAVVVLTDGLANSISAASTLHGALVTGTGNTSSAAVPTATSWSFADSAYPEPWHATTGIALREYRRDIAHAEAAVKADTITLAANMASADQTSVWFVSFRQTDPFMDAASVGDGYYSHIPTGAVSDIVPTFEEIARSLPTSIVK